MNRRRQPSIRRNGQIPKPAESCEQLYCDRNSECLQVMKNGKRRALCMKVKKTDKCVFSPEEGEMPMAGFNSTTVGLSLPDTCQERRCCEGETCIVQSTGDNSLPLAVCIPIPVSVGCSACLHGGHNFRNSHNASIYCHIYVYICMYYQVPMMNASFSLSCANVQWQCHDIYNNTATSWEPT